MRQAQSFIHWTEVSYTHIHRDREGDKKLSLGCVDPPPVNRGCCSCQSEKKMGRRKVGAHHSSEGLLQQ